MQEAPHGNKPYETRQFGQRGLSFILDWTCARAGVFDAKNNPIWDCLSVARPFSDCHSTSGEINRLNLRWPIRRTLIKTPARGRWTHGLSPLELKVKFRVHGCGTCPTSDTYPKLRHATRPAMTHTAKRCECCSEKDNFVRSRCKREFFDVLDKFCKDV